VDSFSYVLEITSTSTSTPPNLGNGGTYIPFPLTLRLEPKHLTLNFAGNHNGPFTIAQNPKSSQNTAEQWLKENSINNRKKS
jgi:hypothetical protein